jgi:ribosomal protein S18 acetylase RimI-like enzyme
MKVEHDPWLAEVLGCDVYRVSPAAGSQSRPRVLQPSHTTAFYYAKVPATQVGLVRGLCAEGFAVVDVNVTFERPTGGELPQATPNVVVRDVQPADGEAVLAIGGSCYVHSRFHLDPLFSQEQAHQVKREWVRNYLLGRRGERLLVADVGGEPVGFLAVLTSASRDRPCRVIDLLGVAPAHQGRGVGRALVRHFLATYDGVCDAVRVGTQVANVVSLRLYERFGFRVADSAYVLHAHVRGGKVVP